MIKVMSIFGTRPEAIKMAPLVKELEKRAEIQSVVCVTAQHREMLDQVLDTFAITPDYDLNIMKQGQTLTDVTVSALKGLENVIIQSKPCLLYTSEITEIMLENTISYSQFDSYFDDCDMLVVTPGYPSLENKYNTAFVHTRAQVYKMCIRDSE